ncbi:MAG TPA: hypothetical protein VEJ20_05310 [Candidatus Eremiobacteraceae bacterium]|nr:hypothetical protein [Candidatus Eremiobacteraceae bacterium]
MRVLRTAMVVAGLACMLCACASSEARLADATTRAIYEDDVSATTDAMTPALRTAVTREQVGAISDLLHSRGDYKGLTETGTEPDGAYDFRADFTRGSFIVKVKVTPSDEISGYRVIPAPT